MKIVDVNVLLYAVNEDAPNHPAARVWLDGALSHRGPVSFTWPVLLAFQMTGATCHSSTSLGVGPSEYQGGIDGGSLPRRLVDVQTNLALGGAACGLGLATPSRQGVTLRNGMGPLCEDGWSGCVTMWLGCWGGERGRVYGSVHQRVHKKRYAVSPQLKLLPPSKPRLGLYLRPGRNDHTVFQQLLAENRAVSGLVLDARHMSRHQHLREELGDNGVMAVLGHSGHGAVYGGWRGSRRIGRPALGLRRVYRSK